MLTICLHESHLVAKIGSMSYTKLLCAKGKSMSATNKYHLLISSLTVILMYLLLMQLLPQAQQWAESEPQVQLLVTILSSIGIYKGLSSLLNFLMSQSVFIKKLVLGGYYMEGTWVGYFIGHAGDKRYVVETFEQDLESLVIRGRSFTSDGKAHANWCSESSSIDILRGKLTYTYSCDILTNKVTHHGIGVFQFDRAGKSKAPSSIQGFVADLVDGQRLEVLETRTSDTIKTYEQGLQDAINEYASV